MVDLEECKGGVGQTAPLREEKFDVTLRKRFTVRHLVTLHLLYRDGKYPSCRMFLEIRPVSGEIVLPAQPGFG